MDALCQVRPAAEHDLSGFVEIERQSFSDPWSRSSFLVLLNDCCWTAESDGQVVGYLIGRTVGDEAEVLNLAVRPESRRRGVATVLLGAAFDRFRIRGAENVYLEVRAANSDAQAFYRSMGFAEQGRRRGYYDDPPDDAVIMRCPITTRKRLEKNGS